MKIKLLITVKLLLEQTTTYSETSENQESGFNEITDTQTPSFTKTSDVQTSDWEDVA